MKALSLIAALAALSPLASPAATFCQGVSSNHIFTVAQKSADVEVTLDDERLIKYSEMKDSKEGTLKISGRNLTYVLVENTTVDEFLKKRGLNRRLAVSMIAGRAEYDGDQDLWYSYADNFYSSLKCH